MKIDLVGPTRRGLAMGLNEAAGYGAVAATAMVTGALAAHYVLRPAPFLLAAAYVALVLGLSTLFVRETRGHARHAHPTLGAHHGELSTGKILALVSFREPTLSASSQAGMVNNLNDGPRLGPVPHPVRHRRAVPDPHRRPRRPYPAVWGLGQLVTGAASDRYGRKPFIVAGMLLQAAALGLFAAAHSFAVWAVAAVLLGAGTAMVYPTLLATIGDVAHPTWRARAVGAYRLWRDGGFAVGALLAGILADAYGIRTATWVVAALTAASGLIVAVRTYETHPRPTTARHD